MPSLTKIQTGFLDPQGAFELDPGTASAPGLFFSGNTSTGMFSPSTGVLGFSTGSTQNALSILANGNIGIGMTNPTYKLDIDGVARASIFVSTSYSVFGSIVVNEPGVNYYSWNNRIGGGLAVVGTTYLDGNVGIGTTNPNAKLHIFNSALDSTLLYLQGNNNYNYEFRTKTGPSVGGQRLDSFIGSSGAEWSFTDGDNVERLRIKSSGEEGLYVRKGIEVSNHMSVSLLLSRNNAEVTKQHFYVHSNNSPWYLYGENLTWTGERSGTTRRANKPYYEGFAPAGGWKEFGFVNKTTADTSFVSTDLVSSLTLLNDGNVGIGTTNPGVKLDVNGDIRFGKQDYSYQGIQKVATLNADGISGLYPQGSFRFYTYPGAINTDTLRLSIRAQDTTLGETSDLITIMSTYADGGRVGIGTTNPVAQFHIGGTASNNNPWGVFDITDAYFKKLHFCEDRAAYGLTGYGGYIGYDAYANTLTLGVYDTSIENRSINIRRETGNVGIGTANPGYKLDVHGSAAFTTGVFFHPSGVVKAAINVAQTANQGVNGTAVDDTYQWTSGGKIIWSTDNGVTPNLVLNSTGNVGIGTPNPGTKLDVYGDIAVNGTFAIRRNNYGYSATYKNVFIGSTDSVSNTVSLCVDTSTISGGNFHGQNQVIIPRQGLLVPNQAGTNFIGVLSKDSNDYIRIGPDSSGGISNGPITVTTSNVGIGTTNPTEKLHVHNGSIRTDGLYGRRFTDFTSTSGTTGYIDTGFAPDTHAAVYQLYISVNPLTAGSSAYRDVVYGKVFYGTGWNGSTVTSYIYFVQESPSRMYNSGSEIFVDVLFLRNGVMYNTLPFSDLYTNTQFRIVVDSPSQVGTYISATFHRVHY